MFTNLDTILNKREELKESKLFILYIISMAELFPKSNSYKYNNIINGYNFFMNEEGTRVTDLYVRLIIKQIHSLILKNRHGV